MLLLHIEIWLFSENFQPISPKISRSIFETIYLCFPVWVFLNSLLFSSYAHVQNILLAFSLTHQT